jgi:glucose/arabinose dehydrogenase
VKHLLPFLLLSLLYCTGCEPSDPVDDANLVPVETKAVVLTQNLQYPWEILWGPDNFIWMTEKGGRISRVDTGSGKVIPVYTIPDVVSQGEGGLLGMALHPQFGTSPYVYVAYDYNNNGYKEKIVRYTFTSGTLTSPFILLDNIAASTIHNGCRLLISGDKLFITTGDAANQSSPQNTASANGKVLRINLDGSIPPDNPIANNPLWSLGHRNPQGLVMIENQLFISEHGPDSDDEINIVQKGGNYGWPTVTGYCNTGSEKSFCTANNVVEPIEAWTPTIATCGMEYYNNKAIPQWRNSLLMTTLKNSRLYQLKLNDAKTAITEINEFYTNAYGRLRDVCVTPNGVVFICSSNGSDDKIIKILPLSP